MREVKGGGNEGGRGEFHLPKVESWAGEGMESDHMTQACSSQPPAWKEREREKMIRRGFKGGVAVSWSESQLSVETDVLEKRVLFWDRVTFTLLDQVTATKLFFYDTRQLPKVLHTEKTRQGRVKKHTNIQKDGKKIRDRLQKSKRRWIKTSKGEG